MARLHKTGIRTAAALSVCLALIVLAAGPGRAFASEGDPAGDAVSGDIVPGANSGWLPEGDLFDKLLADPKQEISYVSLHSAEVDVFGQYILAAVGYAADFGIHRRRWERIGTDFQFGIKGGIFSQFNMDSSSHDLINSDFTIGPAMTTRTGALTSRLRLYHQSTHLGDEFILSGDYPYSERINYSYEAAELILSYKFQASGAGDLRCYGGGHYLLHREPEDLKPRQAQLGAEASCAIRRFPCTLMGGGLIGGVDFKSMEQKDWDWSVSGKAGWEWKNVGAGRHRIRLLFEAYKGHFPFGQFYDLNVTSFGSGLYLYY